MTTWREENEAGFSEFGHPNRINELSVVSTIDDPPKLRLAGPANGVGAISLNIADGDRQIEVGLLTAGMIEGGLEIQVFAVGRDSVIGGDMGEYERVLRIAPGPDGRPVMEILGGGSGMGPAGPRGPRGPKGDPGAADPTLLARVQRLEVRAGKQAKRITALTARVRELEK